MQGSAFMPHEIFLIFSKRPSNAQNDLKKLDVDNKAELIKKIDDADAALKVAIDALSDELNTTNEKVAQLETFMIVVCHFRNCTLRKRCIHGLVLHRQKEKGLIYE